MDARNNAKAEIRVWCQNRPVLKGENCTKRRRSTDPASKAFQHIFLWNTWGEPLHTQRIGSRLCIAETGWSLPRDEFPQDGHSTI